MLPNYFLADLPAEAPLTPAMLGEACHVLRRNREQYLARYTTQELVALLCRMGEEWLTPNCPFRQLALELGPAATGFSQATLAGGLDGFFRQLTDDNLHLLLVQELGHPRRLDTLVATAEEAQGRTLAITTGPELLVHITAGNVPPPALMSMVLGLLARSAQFVKCATGAALCPRLFGHLLYRLEPKLASCLEIAEWPGGNRPLEDALFAAADCVTATGSDETLAQLRARVPAGTRFLGYGHRVSFGFIARESLARHQAQSLARRADVVTWNQLGCLSPHLVYVEHGGSVSPDEFAELLARELERRESLEPRGEVPVETAAAIAARRAFYQVRAAYSPNTRLWASQGSTAWTVVYESDPTFQSSCLHRFIFVKGVRGLEEVLHHAAPVRGQVSTVGLAAPLSRAQDLAGALARWGATRICPLGQMQNPPLTWRHDGHPSLGGLVTWTHWEQARMD
jgi:hypothetical protein